MATSLPQMGQGGFRVWQQLTNSQKLTVGLLAVAAIGLIAGLVVFGQRTDYAAVFTGLSEPDAAAVVSRLKEDKIPYELADSGTTVRVPAQTVLETRLQLASQGLPQGGVVGFELFDKANFGITDFAQKLNYQRALEGELTRTIDRLEGVEQARVHIMIPQAELYTEKEKDATASVVLKLKPGRRLEPKQIGGIGHLVASSVEGLKSENVTILDSNGNTLSDNSHSTSVALAQVSGTQLEMQRAYETNIEKSISSMLDRTIGPGKAAVKVNTVLDWDTNESTSETYGPNDQPGQLRSSKETQERYGGPSSLTGGVPGADANLPGTPGYAQVISGSTNIAYERTDSTKNYEVSKLIAKTNKAPGSVKKLSVAVLLDETMDENQVQSVGKTVATAAGISEERGDVLTVASVPFDRSYVDVQQKEMVDARQQDMYVNIGKAVAVVLASLLVLVILRSLLRAVSSSSAGPAAGGQPALAVQGVGQGSSRAGSNGRRGPEVEIRLPEFRSEEDRRKEAVRQQVVTVVRNKPDRVARLIQSWLKED